jgi:hypothetical protein
MLNTLSYQIVFFKTPLFKSFVQPACVHDHGAFVTYGKIRADSEETVPRLCGVDAMFLTESAPS